MEYVVDSPEYQFENFEEHSALLFWAIHIVQGGAEGFQHASSAIKAMSIWIKILLRYIKKYDR